jgi:polyribonucleotide nucleotidyltransferase
MFNEIKKEFEWNGKTITLETGKVARQASSVIVKMGKSTVLCAVTVSKKASEGIDFLPLTINYLEKFYAAGKIPGGFFKREAKPSDNATLIARLIDRPLRPLFPSNYHNEVNVICTVLSYDPECNPDILALIGSSAALSISEAPFDGPAAAARVGYVDGEYIINPSYEELQNSELELVVAGNKTSVLMVESEAKELSEEVMLGAINFGHEQFQPIIKIIDELKAEAGKEKVEAPKVDTSALKKEISKFATSKITAAYKKQDKQERTALLSEVKDEITEKFVNEEDENFSKTKVKSVIKSLEKEIVRGDIIKSSLRIDGRKADEVRAIEAEVGVLPQVHGSALFTRGETQSLVVATIGSSRYEQMIDGLDDNITKETFMLHYNFPPYSVGETGFLRPPGRREIGHGKLAWRAIKPVFPSQEDFPYVTRVVSEITESNGSSSMATVCGTSLALMDAGVPLPKPVSGIAMGLIKEGDKHVVLSDIMGDEDHLGDMDFKVAGTKDGITALQMDIKINGIDADIMKTALNQANAGRLHILDKMAEALTSARTELNGNVPKMESIKIATSKIKDVIGSRGKVIKGLSEEHNVSIDIDDDGTIKVTGNKDENVKNALQAISDIVVEPEVGTIYEGTVVKVIDAGAFINFINNKDGFVHISELADYRVEFVEDVINEGEVIKVKVIGFDKKGRPKLSYRAVNQETGEDISEKESDSDSDSDSDLDNQKETKSDNKKESDSKSEEPETTPPVKKKRRFF